MVFEELYYAMRWSETHSDLGDESQTVTLKHPQKERTTGAETGDPSDIPRMGAVCLGAGGLAVCLLD